MWPKGTSAASVKAAKAHVLVTLVGGDEPPIQRLLKLTAMTTLCARAKNTLGVYWPYATMVHSPKLFIDMAKEITSPKAPPLYLWVDYRIGKNADGTSLLFTTGLSSMGMMELEIPRINMPPGELREWAVNITYYLIDKGPVLKHGQTIGATAEQQLKIRHQPSQFGKNETVISFSE